MDYSCSHNKYNNIDATKMPSLPSRHSKSIELVSG